ncbi:hypothetical protein KI688_003025 [Linnemannia hyalina]|uniref:Uncharacterized protein n=1 Tax=Linnemannia hyalina TaxID=64524 RepID=A0A9P8BR92_9FUNG|nr:hypothetical protein KI688_003025 [Linnemannia hyalina]
MLFPDSISGISPHVRDLAGLVDRCCQQQETGNARQVFLNSALAMDMARLSTIVQNNVHDLKVSREQRLQATPLSLPYQLVDGPGKFALHGPHLMDPLRTGIQAFVALLGSTDKRINQNFVDPEKLRRHFNGNVALNIYSNVEFLDGATQGSRAGQITITFDQPMKAQGLDFDGRREFWERARGRLMQRGLVYFARRSKGQVGGDYRRHQAVLSEIRHRDTDELSES